MTGVTWCGKVPRRWDYGITCRSVPVTGPTQEPLDVEYVKNSVLRVVNGDEDNEFIGRAITAARQQFERETGRPAMAQTAQLMLSAFPQGLIELPLWPLLSVDSFEYLDINGDTQSLSGSPQQFILRPSGKYSGGRVLPLRGESWPSTDTQEDAVTITYTAGYESTDDMPEIEKAGMCLVIEEMYKNRGLSMSASRVKSVLDTSRYWRRTF